LSESPLLQLTLGHRPIGEERSILTVLLHFPIDFFKSILGESGIETKTLFVLVIASAILGSD
jgi:hypothetical protein